MRVRVLAFASASDALGADEVALEIEVGSRVSDLKTELTERFPHLAILWPRLAIGRNGRLAGDDEELQEDDEIALLPPVSGGAPQENEPPAATANLGDRPLDPAALIRAVTGASRGAVVLFVGTVRDHHDGRAVTGIEYSAYPRMAARRLEQIAAEVAGGGEDLRIAVAHRLGALDVGEASVVIAAASPHREEAYRASRVVLERLKAEVPIWKRERYADGSERWREEETLVPSTR